MNSNELRIGNYYEHEGKYDKIDTQDFWYNWTAKYNAIPITPELLDKSCNFLPWFDEGVKVLHIEAWVKGKDGCRFDIDFRDGVIYLKSRYDEQNLSVQAMPHIKYLHQLQNLVFIIAERELPIDFEPVTI